ncbi:heterokaryon incompatibility protein-domain-containing protein, partial [Pyrenochaeta sp. MPI-SDFR-AT-0127]
MRLLRIEADGEFSLVEYDGKDIPLYAILSHTWGADRDEVTFRDLIKSRGKSKLGYRKLEFCSKQATRNGLKYFWVDTCCIDKTNSSELQEAINSMFDWYHKASRCYAYLSDVSVSTYEGNRELPRNWKAAFMGSRWFTRGWTLQELIAPLPVEFFSEEGQWLGSKKTLEGIICEVTGIDAKALQGCPLSDFSSNERLSWAEKRTTRREEDAAYCLLGIFDVHMPLIYGEGRKHALARLEEQ